MSAPVYSYLCWDTELGMMDDEARVEYPRCVS